MKSFTEAWEFVCNYCRERIAEVAYQTWISRINPVDMDFSAGVAILQVPNEFHKKTLQRCYFNLLKEAFSQIFGSEIEIRLCLPEEIKEDIKEQENKKKNDEYDLTFENFIVGSSNNFAHAAAMAVATKPALTYNPFFIYGNSGLGKTHLLYAIRNQIQKSYPELTIIYIKGDEFTNELIEAIRHGTQQDFHQKYRKADVLLMDDIQFIAGRESTQEEIFHTFNTLYESQKQIVLTSDRPPKEIATLEDRLRTRFESGLIADIQPPDFDTRVAIIKRKAELLDFSVPENVIEYIANRIKSNIRQLEGTIKKLNAYYLLQGKVPSINMAQLAITDIINNDHPTPVTIEKIIEEVARTFGVTSEQIRSKSHQSQISTARQIAIYAVKEITQIPYEAIGKEFGNRDHSTIVYSLKQMNTKLQKDVKMRDTVTDIIKNIRDR